MDTTFEHRFLRHLSNVLPWVSKGRGVIPFFAHVPKLRKVDRLIQADIVGSLLNININICFQH
jgi:hypothetical protein